MTIQILPRHALLVGLAHIHQLVHLELVYLIAVFLERRMMIICLLRHVSAVSQVNLQVPAQLGRAQHTFALPARQT